MNRKIVKRTDQLILNKSTKYNKLYFRSKKVIVIVQPFSPHPTPYPGWTT